MRAAPGRLFLLLLIACAALAALGLNHLDFDHTTKSLLRSDEDADALALELEGTFGSDDLLLAAWELDGALDDAEFRRLARMTAELEALPGMEEVYSIASGHVAFNVDGQLRALRAEDFATRESRARVAPILRSADVYVGTIYNDALDVVAVAGTMRRAPREEREATLRRIREIAERHERPGRPVHVSGVTALAVDASEYAVADLKRIGLLALAVSIAVLYVLRRSVGETLVAVVATGLPPLYALGIAAWLGLPVTALGAALFPVLAVVGITSSVHLLNAYGEQRARGAGARAAAALAARRLAPPIVLSLATTALAFLSLQATGVPAFATAGRVVAIGLLAAVPVILLGLPAALGLIAPPARRASTRRLDRALLGTGIWALRWRNALVACGVIICAGGALLAGRAGLRVDVLQAFQPESRISTTYRFLEERLTATLPVDVVLTARADASDSEVLSDLERYEARARALPNVTNVDSLAKLVRFGKTASPLPVGDIGALIVLRGKQFEAITRRFEDRSARRYRIKVRVREGTSPAVLDGLARATEVFATGDATLTGLFVRAVGTARSLVRDLWRGTLLMTAVVVFTVSVALRSWRLGAVALLPNLLPAAVVFGGAALAGVSLDVSAVAVGAVAIGLAIDDTLHFLFRTAGERGRGRAVLRAQRSVGRALVLSTVVLAAGLGCLLWSNFLPTAHFGLFTAAASIVALASDLVLLPASMRLLGCH